MTAPGISVVVVPFTGAEGLALCLDGLVSQTGSQAMEIIVPFAEDSSIGNAQSGHPSVRFIAVPDAQTPAELRAWGVDAAQGEIVGVLEDHCIPDREWCTRMLRWHSHSHAAVGGAIEKGMPPDRAGDSALNWAVYLADYSRYMNPAVADAVHSASDVNASYKRENLLEIRDLWKSEFHENVVNDALRARGHSIWFAPDAIVHETRHLSVGEALRDRFVFGRVFGSTRVAGAHLPRRLMLAAASVLMPPVLTLRVARTVFSRRKHRGRYVVSLPQLALVNTAWIAGELVGYLTARPGPGPSARPRVSGR